MWIKLMTLVLLMAVSIPMANGVAGEESGQPKKLQRDTFATSQGELAITFVGHGTLMLEWDGKVIHVDPWTQLNDYSSLPKADVILLTHQHRDHFDLEAVKALRMETTAIVLTEVCAETLSGGIVMKNGDEKTIDGIPVKAVAAYNLVHKRENGEPYHPKGMGNGYVLTLGDTVVYIAGDTEDIPEMKELSGKIGIAFLPMNLPYTMTPEMTAHAATMFMPKILYPYHYGETDTNELVKLLKDTPQIELRIRDLQ